MNTPQSGKNQKAQPTSSKWLRHTTPILLLLLCPPTVILMWFTNAHLDGSFMALGAKMMEEGIFTTIWAIWGPVFFGSATAWKIIGIYVFFQLAFMKLVPGKPYYGPETPNGHIPLYKDNGLAVYLLTIASFCGAGYGLGWFNPAILYDHMGGLMGAMNIFSLVFCLFLYLKGRYKPSGPDSGLSGSPIFDYYWGTELYPRILGWDIKQFTNCRFGMMGWPLLIISFAAKQQEFGGITDAMLVMVGLQLISITKFFIWETGYLRTMDIQVDRAGFYICWGCLVWLPMVYTSHTHYLASHQHTLGWPLAALIFVVGTLAIFINYIADWQKQAFRAKNGDLKIWGKPAVAIKASYVSDKGEKKESLLLASGFWGISRHFHYIPEILAAFCWSVPALFDNFMPYFYVVFLTILLTHRAVRDEERCSLKYGSYWDEYKKLVPYKIIPGIW